LLEIFTEKRIRKLVLRLGFKGRGSRIFDRTISNFKNFRQKDDNIWVNVDLQNSIKKGLWYAYTKCIPTTIYFRPSLLC
jgi:hypothetical protein